MAENKKSFVLYSDSQGLVNQLPDDVAGRLLKHIYAYVNDENPISSELLLNVAFEPIKMQLKRDLIKWESTKEGRSLAGKASAEARRLAKINEQNLTNPTNVDFVQQNSTNPTVNDNVNVSVSVNDNVKDNNIDSRKLKFASTLKPFVEVYGRDLLKDFYDYWTEPNKSNTKFRQELEKTWSLERRLQTWTKNETNFKNQKNGNSKLTSTSEFNQIVDAIKSDGVRR